MENNNTPKFKFKGALGNTSVNYDDVAATIDFLRDLMVAHKVNILEGLNQSYNMDFQSDEKKFKLIPHDIGLLSSMIGMTYQKIKAGENNYNGFLAEVFVASEFISAMTDNNKIELFSF